MTQPPAPRRIALALAVPFALASVAPPLDAWGRLVALEFAHDEQRRAAEEEEAA